MLNSKLKKEALEELKVAEEKYMKKYQSTVNKTIILHGRRSEAALRVKDVEVMVNRLVNTPKEFDRIVADVAAFGPSGASVM